MLYDLANLTMPFLLPGLMVLTAVGLLLILRVRNLLFLLPLFFLIHYFFKVDDVHRFALAAEAGQTEVVTVRHVQPMWPQFPHKPHLLTTNKGEFVVHGEANNWINKVLLMRTLTNTQGTYARHQFCDTNYNQCRLEGIFTPTYFIK